MNSEFTNFTFFRSYFEALKIFRTDEEKLRFLMLVIEYGLSGKEPTPDNGLPYGVFALNAMPTIKKGHHMREVTREKNARRAMRKKEAEQK